MAEIPKRLTNSQDIREPISGTRGELRIESVIRTEQVLQKLLDHNEIVSFRINDGKKISTSLATFLINLVNGGEEVPLYVLPEARGDSTFCTENPGLPVLFIKERVGEQMMYVSPDKAEDVILDKICTYERDGYLIEKLREERKRVSSIMEDIEWKEEEHRKSLERRQDRKGKKRQHRYR